MRMPEPDADVLSRRERIVRDLARIVPGEGIIADTHALKAGEAMIRVELQDAGSARSRNCWRRSPRG